ncbi:glycosyltransferase family 2 protein [Salegentibacter sp. JZCK2]|uniref:glycosyltransferase family 2 protein n=1 Tax=Salegentibacter tibetensis TaxID=2873600 RepID=UPI001CC9EC49|nr:glycosyltransferase family 2 protein [Salegentibacter tibetensis]MBZ9731296.1 glycosyltransferase family 2 protein [Salegentibacter tibetensis]
MSTIRDKKIIVLTPVKNEAWILERFLQVTSIFADHIIIADQNSTDGSLEIYSRYPKVILINNKNSKYNESDRQLLLITTARKLFGTGNILLAIDADEILAANAMETMDWKRMMRAKPGTILYFEKPTLYKNTQCVIRYDGGGWPLGYVDDGAAHLPSVIHSVRIPTPKNAEKLYLDEIKFLHYALVRLDAQASKQRMYSVLENIKKTKKLRFRRRVYNSNLDFSREGDRRENSKMRWFKGWEEKGIDMHTVKTSKYYWYDFEVVNLLDQYGTYRFWWDDIWNFDWENFRRYGIEENLLDKSIKPIRKPSPLFLWLMKCYFQSLDYAIFTFKNLSRQQK